MSVLCCSVSPGGLIEDVPRGTTAGQILREKGVFAILDPAATPSSSSSDSDSDSSRAAGDAVSASSSASSSRLDRSGLQQQQQQLVSANQQQLVVNVNNRLVAEDTVLRDGDLVILAREKIKI